MNIKQLEAFVCVADEKSFSLAAKKLYLTQPTVSAHIQALEEELGVRLFNRTRKEVGLSADGKRLYENAAKMLQLEEAILSDFKHQDAGGAQTITISASTVPGQYILPQFLSLFSKTYPGKKLEMSGADSLEVVAMVRNGDAEVGFAGTRVEDPTLIFEPFYLDHLVVITPNSETYRWYEDTGFPLEGFYDENWIVREEGSGTRKETEAYLRKRGIDLKLMHVVAAMSSQEMIKKSVSIGMGLSVISSAAAEDYVRQGSILRFPLAEGNVYRRLYMVWSKKHKPGYAARTFIQFMREQCAYL